MNDFQKHIPNYWVRYPTRFLCSVLETTIQLLLIGGHGGMTVQPSQFITPIHYLALLDPMAEWFKHWTVSIPSLTLSNMQAIIYSGNVIGGGNHLFQFSCQSPELYTLACVLRISIAQLVGRGKNVYCQYHCLFLL